LAGGRPLVTTTYGTCGIEIGIGNAFFVANTGADFIQAIEKPIENAALRKKKQIGA